MIEYKRTNLSSSSWHEIWYCSSCMGSGNSADSFSLSTAGLCRYKLLTVVTSSFNVADNRIVCTFLGK